MSPERIRSAPQSILRLFLVASLARAPSPNRCDDTLNRLMICRLHGKLKGGWRWSAEVQKCTFPFGVLKRSFCF